MSSTTNMSPQISETDKTRMEIQDCFQIPGIQSNTAIAKNEDGSNITQNVEVLVWWRDVGQVPFPRITVMTRPLLTIPVTSTTTNLVFSFAGLTLSDLHKSLLEGTLQTDFADLSQNCLSLR